MTVKDLLNKKNGGAFILICKDYNCGNNINAEKSHLYIETEEACDIYGNKEVKHYDYFYDKNYNKIVMCIKIIENIT